MSLRDSFCGTYQFIAPEQYQSELDGSKFEYSGKTDIWSLGVILYTLVTGSNPFTRQAESLDHMKYLIQNVIYTIPDDIQKYGHIIQPEARDLIGRLLQTNSKDRPTLKEIKQHPFFTSKYIIP